MQAVEGSAAEGKGNLRLTEHGEDADTDEKEGGPDRKRTEAAKEKRDGERGRSVPAVTMWYGSTLY